MKVALLSYKFVSSKTVEAKLNEQLELCRWLYNRLLEEVNRAGKGGKSQKHDTRLDITFK
ncbi:helix-turn-helix domain-containing protein [Archaeoglobus sp.]